MLRDDIKEKLKDKNLDELFLQHRPEFDQPGYRVGDIDGEIVVMNESTKEIMDYFYDDEPYKEWFDITLIAKYKKHFDPFPYYCNHLL